MGAVPCLAGKEMGGLLPVLPVLLAGGSWWCCGGGRVRSVRLQDVP
jgi:hypothetical protein